MAAACDELSDLFTFLADERPEMRVAAAELVQGLTGAEDGLAQLVQRAAEVVPPLLRMLGRSATEAQIAATTLVNLTTDRRAVEAALAGSAVDRVMERLHSADSTPELRSLLVMVLANLTVTLWGSQQLLQEGRGALEGFHLGHLLRLLGADAGAHNAHAAHVAGNVSALPLGRHLLLRDGTHAGLLARVLASPTAAPTARQGAALALRNLALDSELCPRLLCAADGVLVPALLSPLARHSSADEPLREACADALAAVAGSAEGRKALWAAKAPDLLRRAYEDEQARGVCAALEHAAELLMSDGREMGEGGETGAVLLQED